MPGDFDGASRDARAGAGMALKPGIFVIGTATLLYSKRFQSSS